MEVRFALVSSPFSSAFFPPNSLQDVSQSRPLRIEFSGVDGQRPGPPSY